MKNMFLKVPYDNYMFVTDKLGNEMKGFRLGWAMATTANIAFCREGAEKIFLMKIMSDGEWRILILHTS